MPIMDEEYWLDGSRVLRSPGAGDSIVVTTASDSTNPVWEGRIAGVGVGAQPAMPISYEFTTEMPGGFAGMGGARKPLGRLDIEVERVCREGRGP